MNDETTRKVMRKAARRRCYRRDARSKALLLASTYIIKKCSTELFPFRPADSRKEQEELVRRLYLLSHGIVIEGARRYDPVVYVRP